MDAASQIITLVKMTRVNVVVVVVVEAVCLCEQQAGGRGLVEHCARQENWEDDEVPLHLYCQTGSLPLRILLEEQLVLPILLLRLSSLPPNLLQDTENV